MKQIAYDIRMYMRDLKKAQQAVVEIIQTYGSIKAAWKEDGIANIRVLWKSEKDGEKAEQELKEKICCKVW